MCGIIGIYRKSGLKKKDVIKFAQMLQRCQKRGSHAAGMFNQNEEFYKAPLEASKITQLPRFVDFLQGSIGCKYVVGHCRLATRGDPKKNRNNHPIYDPAKKIFLVHNGIVECKEFDKTPDNTDTWVFMHGIVEKEKEECTEKKSLHDIVNESFSIICDKATRNSSVIVVGSKEELVMIKNKDKPLVWKEQDNDCIVFGSETVIINSKDEDDGKDYMVLQPYKIASIDLETGEVKVGAIKYIPRWSTYEGRSTIQHDKDYLSDSFSYSGTYCGHYDYDMYGSYHGSKTHGRGKSHKTKTYTDEIFSENIAKIDESLTDDNEYPDGQITALIMECPVCNRKWFLDKHHADDQSVVKTCPNCIEKQKDNSTAQIQQKCNTDDELMDDVESESERYSFLYGTCMSCSQYDPDTTTNCMFKKGLVFCSKMNSYVDLHACFDCVDNDPIDDLTT